MRTGFSYVRLDFHHSWQIDDWNTRCNLSFLWMPGLSCALLVPSFPFRLMFSCIFFQNLICHVTFNFFYEFNSKCNIRYGALQSNTNMDEGSQITPSSTSVVTSLSQKINTIHHGANASLYSKSLMSSHESMYQGHIELSIRNITWTTMTRTYWTYRARPSLWSGVTSISHI